MLHMNTSEEGGQSFNSAFAQFMGGDVTQVETVKRMSIEAGIQSSIHNTIGLSTARATLGLTPTSDGFLHLLRTTFAENPKELNEYVYNSSTYITVLRVTPPAGRGEGPAFKPDTFNQRVSEPEGVTSISKSYNDLYSALANDLKNGILNKYSQSHPFVQIDPLDGPSFNNGYDCMDQGLQCNGDNQDTLYPNSRFSLLKSKICSKLLREACPIHKRTTLQEDGSDFFIATGVNHNATGRALYSNIAMYNIPRLESLGSFSSVPINRDSNSYVGSAQEYLKDSTFSPYLFAVKITRKCLKDETFCLEVKESGSNSLPLDGSCLFIERIYLDQMLSGPSNNATIKPIIYHFSSNRFNILKSPLFLILL